jgi:hypothetical protein
MRTWTAGQIKQQLTKGRVSGFVGHHISSVSQSALFARIAENIEFLTRREHFRRHGFNWRMPTFGDFLLR